MEIRNWLNDYQPLEKEIFLATGEGKGISNINPLEAIAGKCNVVCSSTDQRNPQPSEEELKMADYIFHCTFDVGTFSISDKIGDSVAGIEVSFLFNRKGQIAKSATADARANGKLKIENNGTTVSEKDQILSDKLDDRPLKKMKATVASEKVKDGTGLGESSYNSDKEDVKPSNPPDSSEEKTKTRIVKDSVCREKETSKLKVDDTRAQKFSCNSDSVDGKASYEKAKTRIVKDSVCPEKETLKLNVGDTRARLSCNSDAVDGKASNNKEKTRIAEDSVKGSVKVKKTNEQSSRPSNGTLLKSSLDRLPSMTEKLQNQTSEVAKKQEIDKSNWFKQEPWEDKMKTAAEEGTLVLLQNLDPSNTSKDVEDLISRAFQKKCDARMVRWTTFSSPYSGRAFVIFKSKKDAAEALMKLEKHSLILPNKRPLIGSEGLQGMPELHCKFFGHLFIDKFRPVMQREEMKKAVSTSHCSQPNTIEYEMAMDWELLQEKSKEQWKALNKGHENEVKQLKKHWKMK
ncbi:hypothetical protein QJS10_CPA07g00561 [Acorus calamus]|uniref:RRM domain-containing protein n=1 Tax=Acorus calamus TaxID=4465 RepID=A0AAV9EGV3_ACOCL|nr:hypothetical protein QJS10_CPA07g00561 [Acorus calamus]